jgi:hypothetical protein
MAENQYVIPAELILPCRERAAERRLRVHHSEQIRGYPRGAQPFGFLPAA